MKTIPLILKPGKEKPIKGRHPWIYSGAIDEIDESYETGDLVRVYSAEKEYLGTGYLNPRSQIAVRMLTQDDRPIDRSFFEERIERALELRRCFLPASRGRSHLSVTYAFEGADEKEKVPGTFWGETNAYRVIHSEGDFLPGLIVDRYAGYLVVQFQTAGIEKWKEEIISILEEKLTGEIKGIFEKDDSEMREWEGLEKRVGRLRGEEPPDFVEIRESGIPFIVDIHGGQKTGFFLDQRENRKLVAGYAKGRRVLNCFAYTGGFSVYAAKAGATRVVSVETSERALNTCRENFALNGFSPSPQPSPQRGEGESVEGESPPGGQSPFSFVKADVFEYLRSTSEEFDLIIVDPPAFAKSKEHVMQASRAYKDLNLWALKRLTPGGLLYTCSCSSYVDPDLFQKIIFAAAKDARRDVQIAAKTSHAPDHPINVFHPEGEYLKGLLCLVS